MAKQLYYVRKENDGQSYYNGEGFGSKTNAKEYTWEEAENTQRELNRIMVGKTIIVSK